MPRILAPHKSGLHRVACLSLYRSLLRESTRVGIATGTNTIAESLRSLIRHRFHKDRKLLSQSQVANGIKAGHGFLSLLCNCSAKSSSALNQLTQTLEQVTLQAESTSAYRAELASRWKPPPPKRHAHLKNLRRVANKANHISSPENPRIFQHPRPISEVKTGVRKVPNLILTQGIPLLKYPGPVPVLVNRVLKEKILWGVRKWEQHKDLQSRIQMAEWEDDWDKTLARQEGFIEDDGLPEQEEGQTPSNRNTPGVNIRYYDPQSASTSPGPSTSPTISFNSHSKQHSRPSLFLSLRHLSWTTHLRQVHRSLELAVMERGKQYALLGDRYWHEVVVKERDLKEKERKEKKHARRMARKRASNIFGAEGEIVERKQVDVEVSSVSSGFI